METYTIEQYLISEGFGPATREHFDRLVSLCEAGLRHGRNGWYAEYDFSSDSDWCYGVGSLINWLEDLWDIDDGAVFDLYSQYHGIGFAEYLESHNSSSEEEI